MKRGLIIGKFMPVHAGHLALIEFAAPQCDELIVSMSYTNEDPIDESLRFGWLTALLKNLGNVVVEKVKDDFDNEMLPLEDRTKIWAEFITRRFPKVNVIFSSETYGEPFAKHLAAEAVHFDLDRKMIPVSASQIREKPFKHWEFIPTVVRPYYVKKICFYGPESTGKTEMAMQMAVHYKTEFVPEVARETITSNDFTIEDIISIGKAQTSRMKEKAMTSNKLLFCDTDLITTQIYSQHYLDTVPSILKDLEKEIQYAKYFLFDIDVPWVSDGLRDLGDQRETMFEIFKSQLERRKITYTLVSGSWQQRFEIIRNEVDKLLTK